MLFSTRLAKAGRVRPLALGLALEFLDGPAVGSGGGHLAAGPGEGGPFGAILPTREVPTYFPWAIVQGSLSLRLEVLHRLPRRKVGALLPPGLADRHALRVHA